MVGRAVRREQGSRVLVARQLLVHDQVEVLVSGISRGGALDNILAGWRTTELGHDEGLHIVRPCREELLKKRLENRINLRCEVFISGVLLWRDEQKWLLLLKGVHLE